MGLDNGIYMKSKNKNIKIPKWINNWDYWGTEDIVDICYWRKWYNFRNEVISFLPINNEGEANLNTSDLERILIVLKKINKNTWIDNGWEWKVVKPMIHYSKKAIKWATKQKEKYKNDIEFIFYDSF